MPPRPAGRGVQPALDSRLRTSVASGLGAGGALDTGAARLRIAVSSWLMRAVWVTRVGGVGVATLSIAVTGAAFGGIGWDGSPGALAGEGVTTVGAADAMAGRFVDSLRCGWNRFGVTLL